MGMTTGEALAFAANLIRTVQTEDYPDQLIGSLRAIADFDIFAAVEYLPDGLPTLFSNNLALFVPRPVIERFVTGTYLLDAVYTATRNGIASGLYRLSDLAPDDYFASDFYNSSDFHPCISDTVGSLSEEIVYIARRPDNACLVFSLMRSKGLPQFSESEFADLSAVKEIVNETMMRQWTSRAAKYPFGQARDGADGALEKAFSSFASGILSTREQMIVSLLLRGHSTLSTAHTLNIAEGTVKVHRKHIYEKLGINSQAQMFVLFCSHIARGMDIT